MFFAIDFITFLITLFAWGVGHLRGGESGLGIKLVSWWVFSQLTPTILLNYLIPRAGPYPPYIDLPFLVFGFAIYLAIYYYLRDGLEKGLRKITLYFPFGFLVFISLFVLVGWVLIG